MESFSLFAYALRCRCLQHPYLIADDIEPKGLARDQAHLKLIDASTKLRLLKSLLSKLKERGHRVLLFSQVCPAYQCFLYSRVNEHDSLLSSWI